VIARSYLYVPGNRPERFGKALASGPDAVIFDLEDAVPVAVKDDALGSVIASLDRRDDSASERWVRINSGARGLDDLRAVARLPGLTGILVPKATPESLAEICLLAGGLRISALVESAVGVLRMAEMAGLMGVDQLVLGEVDLAADLGMSTSSDGRELDSIRINAVVVSAAFDCRPPVGPVWTDIRDLDGLRASTDTLRRLGFSGRQAIHPKQVEIINDGMTPSVAEREEAAHVLELARRADGGVCVDENGRMIDEAVLRSARRICESE
jgi:citrate lyase subunit beta / citryl-CoA lyase